MRQHVLKIDPYAAADPDGISVSSTPAAGGIQDLAIDGAFASGGVATLDTPRQVGITSAADETGRTFLIKGADRKGNQIIEAITGANIGVASTVRAFKTVTSIQVDDDTAGAVEAGTITVVSTDWFPMDIIRNPVNVGLGLIVGGATADMTVELTLSNLLSRKGNFPEPPHSSHVGSEFKLFYPTVNAIDHDTLINVTADASGNIAFPVTALRLTSNVIIVTNEVILEIAQAGHRGA